MVAWLLLCVVGWAPQGKLKLAILPPIRELKVRAVLSGPTLAPPKPELAPTEILDALSVVASRDFEVLPRDSVQRAVDHVGFADIDAYRDASKLGRMQKELGTDLVLLPVVRSFDWNVTVTTADVLLSTRDAARDEERRSGGSAVRKAESKSVRSENRQIVTHEADLSATVWADNRTISIKRIHTKKEDDRRRPSSVRANATALSERLILELRKAMNVKSQPTARLVASPRGGTEFRER